MKPACLPLILFGALTCFQSAFSFIIPGVGYINISLEPGFNLISVPLKLGNSEIAGVFGSQNNLPDGLTVYIMEEGIFHGTTYFASSGQFEPTDIAQETIPPGRAFFVYNPSRTQVLLTFAGEIPQGRLTNFLPAGFSAVAPMIPRSGTLSAQGFPTAAGDTVYLWNARTQTFYSSTYDDIDNAWLPREESISAGEGFILVKRQPAEWTIDFALNP
jgi:hypothetical protein